MGDGMTASTDVIDRFRAGFRTTHGVHLNNAGVAPMAVRAAEAIARCTEQMVGGGSLGMDAALLDHERGREAVARLVGARKDHVSMMQTCAAALSQLAFGIPLREGDVVVRWEQEYPSNAYPWHRAAERAGAQVHVVPSGPDFTLNTDDLLAAIDGKTRVVTVSWVQFSTGQRTDLARVAEACQKHDAWLVVDAIQGLGVLPFDLGTFGVDAVCGGTHKWLCGPVGHGFLAFAEGRRDEVEPLLHGAITYGTPDDAVDPARSPRHDPRRFEPGTPTLLGTAGCTGALEHLFEAGIERLNAHAVGLSERLAEGVLARGGRVLSERGDGPRSPITTFLPRGDPAELSARLREREITHARRAGGIRIAPHGFNTAEEIDLVLEVMGA